MKRKAGICLILALMVFCSGCASIVSKSMYPVTINSHPDGAQITIQDERGKFVYKGSTPTTISLASGEGYFHSKSYDVTFSKAGYGKRTVTLKSELDGWYIGNILFGGLIGMLIVDPLTGAMWKLPPDITVTLSEQFASNNSEQTFQIATIDQIPESLKKNLVRIN
jgi:hypothetical protein